jgi:hypothetical protein
MSSPGIRPRNSKLAAGGQNVPMADVKKGAPQPLRVLSQDGTARAAAPSIVMPRAKTELSELLAGDDLLCVRRRTVATAVQQDPSANMRVPAAYAGTQAESLASLSTKRSGDGPDAAPRAHLADADLAGVIDAWPGLPRNVRAAILAMIRETATGEV